MRRISAFTPLWAFEEKSNPFDEDLFKVDTNTNQANQEERKDPEKTGYEIKLEDLSLADNDEKVIPGTEEKINLSVKEESRVSIYEANEMARVKLVLALTKNHQDFL
jgi:hypothetical protein